MSKPCSSSIFQSIYFFFKAVLGIETRKDRFSRYAHKNKWGNEESVSGPGSTLQYTENIRKEIPVLLKKLRVKSILDAPCGDFNWAQHLKIPDVNYIGGDIVPKLIKDNQTRYSSDKIKFIELDIVKDNLPDVDLWLCRDALFHFSEVNIFETLANFLKSNIDYLLTTSHPECDANHDIRTGAFRNINLLLPPFNFPKPEACMDDWIEGFSVRQLCLWKREKLAKALANHEKIQSFM